MLLLLKEADEKLVSLAFIVITTEIIFLLFCNETLLLGNLLMEFRRF
jgi:hypothetical protein